MQTRHVLLPQRDRTASRDAVGRVGEPHVALAVGAHQELHDRRELLLAGGLGHVDLLDDRRLAPRGCRLRRHSIQGRERIRAERARNAPKHAQK